MTSSNSAHEQFGPVWVVLSGSFLFQRGWGMPLVASSRKSNDILLLDTLEKTDSDFVSSGMFSLYQLIDSGLLLGPFPIVPWSSIKMAEGTRERLWIGVPIILT